MRIEELKSKLPDFAKDIKLNLANVLTADEASGLTQKQVYEIALACAYSLKNTELKDAIFQDAKSLLSDQEIEAPKAAATIMAMNNVYYRFLHLTSDKSFGTLPAKLRMNVIANPGVDKIDFELMSIAVSALNGCGLCIDSHTKALLAAGVSKTAIQTAVRIAAVLSAVAVGLEV